MIFKQFHPDIIKSILQVNIHINKFNNCYNKITSTVYSIINQIRYILAFSFKTQEKLPPVFMKFIKIVNKRILHSTMISIKNIKNINDYNIGIMEIKYMTTIYEKPRLFTIFINHTFINKEITILHDWMSGKSTDNKLIYHHNYKFLNLLSIKCFNILN